MPRGIRTPSHPGGKYPATPINDVRISFPVGVFQFCILLTLLRSIRIPSVTVHLLYHGIFLFSFLRRTHMLFGMYSYDWIHTLILLSPLNSSFIEL